MRRRLERAILGGLMSVVALVLDRRVSRALAKR
jgi:hypothetical protein